MGKEPAPKDGEYWPRKNQGEDLTFRVAAESKERGKTWISFRVSLRELRVKRERKDVRLIHPGRDSMQDLEGRQPPHPANAHDSQVLDL